MTTTPRRVHQVLATLGYGDAIGHEVLGIQRALRAAGFESEIFVETADRRLEALTRDYRELIEESRPDQLLIHHFSIGSRASRVAYALPDRMALVYHNITPPEYFIGVHKRLVELCYHGRRELRAYVGRVALALGDSEYNRQELAALGFAPTGVMPIAVNTRRVTDAPPRPALERVLAEEGWANFLFVGRIAPNKRIEDHIKLAEVYKRYVDEEYRFVFVGRHDTVPSYYAAIRQLMLEFKMPEERFWFTGPVPDEDLATYYRAARVYVSLSEHEGFCVPLLEAMAADVPVLAYAAGAVSETLGGAGVTFAPKDLEFAAELLGELAYDDDLRARVIAGQRARLPAFGDEAITAGLERLVGRFA